MLKLHTELDGGNMLTLQLHKNRTASRTGTTLEDGSQEYANNIRDFDLRTDFFEV